ncbi:cyclopentanol dehydrogenase [Luminiphilus syltensis NOR5-1B]|uniref:Cyclopentanol dehydrogenase n=1 Tax=Luminiphilus syltensis NOR5-1B TaxID=565045 RepID=B8KSP4_9GAMM|nr:SDR family NAD(P)-dependent oxidoreductase [Luminiphilus syltensis]EED35848.1 cyclopentanol dehydrogenase [Luminiphilus syltensis NOR5-1B]
MALLENKVCLITGAASNPGLGHSIAHRFGEQGATVIVTDMDGAGAERTASEINDAGGTAVGWGQNVTSRDEWVATLARIKSDYGRIDVLVNNAGIAVLQPLEAFTMADYEKQMSVNMTSVFMGTQLVVEMMREDDIKGSIVNMSSVAALVGVVGVTAYAASKAGVHGFTKAVAAETARQGIRCNTLHPGMILTNMNAQAATDNPEEYKIIVDKIPMGYMGPPSSIADAALFLASDMSSYVTGTELVIDGGLISV